MLVKWGHVIQPLKLSKCPQTALGGGEGLPSWVLFAAFPPAHLQLGESGLFLYLPSGLFGSVSQGTLNNTLETML